MQQEEALQTRQRRMGRVLVWSNLLSEPLFTVYNFLGFILYKDLGASAFTLALMTMLKPIATILSFYWSSGLRRRGANLKSNALWAGFWMRAPFLLCPWICDVWFVVAAAVNYMFWYRAGIPAWVEMLKRNLDSGVRERAFSLSSGLAYAEGVVLSLAVGALLDHEAQNWKYLLAGSSLIGLLGLALVQRVQVEEDSGESPEGVSWKELLISPWRDSLLLMKNRPDFARFQWGFMICGFGVMLIQPALPLIAIDRLEVSYLEIAAAVSIAKGLGFALSAPIWARWFGRVCIFRISSVVFLSVGLFPLLLSLSPFNGLWLYAAYFWYGVGQGGSHLVWNMSGPVFAGKEESSRYTGVNVALAGLRGAIGPGLGGWLAMIWGPIQVLYVGALFCLYSGFLLLSKADEKKSLSVNE